MNSNYPNGFSDGITIRGIPLLQTHTGKVFWVYNGTALLTGQKGGSNGNKGTFDAPFSTIDYAIGQCSANRGDIIFVKAGHSETISAASAITCDIAGVAIVGLGQGTDRPELTFSTLVGASVVISAANVSILNIVGIGNKDALTQPFDVQATDCYIDIEWRDTSSTIEAARAILTTDAADRLTVKMKYRGQTGGDACVNAIRLVGVDGADIDIDFYGKASTAVVEFLTTACTNVTVNGYTYVSGTTDGSKNVVDTVGTSTWYSDIVDGAAGARYTGGSASAVAKDDVSAVLARLGTDADTNAIGALISGSAGIATMPAAAVPANGVNAFELLRQIWANQCGTAANENGITTFPAAAVPGNNVSIAEVLRDVWDALRNGTGGTEPGENKSIVDALGFDGAAAVTSTAGMLRTAAGSVFVVKKTLTSSAIVQAGVDVTAVSSGGEIEVMSVHLMTDATGLATGTNVTLETNNTKGKAIFLTEAVASLGANATIISYLGAAGLADAGSFAPLLESGKKIVAKSTVADCTGGGTVDVYLVCRRLADGASLAAA